MRESAGLTLGGVTLRDVDIKTALVVPDNDDGVEIITRLQEPKNTDSEDSWQTFSVESLAANGEWTVHCDGRISASHKPSVRMSRQEVPVDESILTQRVSGKRWYDAFERVGFNYGKTFQQLQQVRTDRSVFHATADMTVCESSGVMKGESRYLIHPTTIDACLQLTIISIHAGKHKDMPWGVVPTRIEEMALYAADIGQPVTDGPLNSIAGHAEAWTNGFDGRRFNTNVRLNGVDGKLLLDVKNLTCITYEAALPASSIDSEKGAVEPTESNPFSVVKWKPDITSLRENDFLRLWPGISTASGRISKCIELISHRQVVRKAFIVARTPSPQVQSLVEVILDALPSNATMTVGFDIKAQESVQSIKLSKKAHDRVSVVALGTAPESWLHENSGLHDLAIVESHNKKEGIPPENVLTFLKEGGWLLGVSTALFSTPFPSPKFTLNIGEQAAFFNSQKSTIPDGARPRTASGDDMTVLSAREGGYDLRSILSEARGQYKVCQKLVKNGPLDRNHRVVIDDTTGAISASMLADPASFDAIKAVLLSGVRVLWVTRGARQGRVSATTAVRMGMAEGLLRALRSEQAASKIVLLDFDLHEEPRNVAAAIIGRLEAADTKGSGRDTEFWLHEGVLHVGRVYPKEGIEYGTSPGEPQEKLLAGNLKISAQTTDGQLVFEDEDLQSTVLASGEIELQVLASQWPSHTRGTQVLVEGIIIGAGSSESRELIGKTAIAFVYDGFRTVIRTSGYAIIDDDNPDRISPEVLVGIMPPLCPIVHLCLINAKLEKGDFVLSLPGPKADVRSLKILAKALGWNMSAVARSASEWDEYISQVGLTPEQIVLSGEMGILFAFIREQHEKSSSGTITIIAHDFDSLSHEVWRHIPPSCRFLLLNKTSLNVVPDPLPFSRGATFVSSNMKSLHASPRANAKLLKLTLDLLETHSSLLVGDGQDSINVVDVGEARDIGAAPTDEENEKATVVRYCQGESRVKVSLQRLTGVGRIAKSYS